MGTRSKVALLALALLLPAAACSDDPPTFDCDRPGATCGELAGAVCIGKRCAGPSADCASGLQYADNAGDLAGTCVDAADGQGGYTITADASAFLRPGESLALPIRIVRSPGFSGPIEVGVDDLPAGLSVDPLTLAADAEQGELMLHAAADAAPGTQTDATLFGSTGQFRATSALPALILGAPGTLDAAFGKSGQLALPLVFVLSVVPQPGGKFVVGGIHTSGGLGLARFTRDGALDPSFGNSGAVVDDLASLGGGSLSECRLLVQSTGKLVAVCNLANGADSDLAIVRYDADGQPDSTLRLRHGLGGLDTLATAIALGPQDQIVVAGAVDGVGATPRDVFVARFDANGQVDETFDADGVATWNKLDYDRAASVAVDGEGRVVVATTSTNGPGDVMHLIRFKATGALETNFGATLDGAVSFPFPQPNLKHVSILADGKILVAGAVRVGSTGGDPALWRLDSGGRFDATFGTSGLWAAPATTLEEDLEIALPDGQGGYIAAGTGWGDPLQQAVFAHVDADGVPVAGFGTSGVLLTGIASEVRAAIVVDGGRLLSVGSGAVNRALRAWF